MSVVFSILFMMNIIGLMSMGFDKLFAKQGWNRVPESTLLLIALFGGCIGSWAGMYLFRHKTQHLKFVWGMPIIFILHLALIAYYLIVIN